MSIFQKIGSIFSSGGLQTAKTDAAVHVVDILSLGGAGGNNPRLSPRVQIDLLQALSQFSKREGVVIHAVMAGEPLRQVPDNQAYREIQVNYAETAQDLPGLTAKLIKSYMKRNKVVVITSNRTLEEASTRTGASLMRASTFRKVLPQKSSGGNGRQQNSRRRPPRRNKPKNNPDKATGSPGKDRVSDLIDLV